MVAALASSSRIAPSSQTMDASFLSPPLHSTADSSSNHSNRFSSNTDFPLSIMAGIVSSRHGIRQIRNGWADGPAYITQCPIQTGQSYVYNYTIVGQRGTLFWHAHISWLRATVYGALIILPKHLSSYPFPKPYKDVTLIFGEWFNGDIEAMINQATLTGGGPDVSDA